jgi:FkbM family methyltransferase
VTARPVQVLYPQGWRIELPGWSELAGVTVATGLHEPAEELFVLALVRPGDLVVDVGANIGIYTISCAAMGARVAAFEPASRAREALERNVRINHLGDAARIFPVALGATSGSASITTDLDVGNHLVTDNGDHPVTDNGDRASVETVPVRPLDGFLAEHRKWVGGSGPMLVKIDVEGHDEAVLQGARGTLAECQPVVLVETWDGGREVRALLAALGYRVYRYDYDERALVEYPPDWRGQANFIAVTDARLAEVRARILSAPTPIFAPPRMRWLVDRE